MKLLLGTNNQNKIAQFKRIFKNLNSKIKLVSLNDFGIYDDVKEDCNNLLDNAKKKAKYYAERSGLIALADDTGLFIDSLNGEPGVHSKRWHTGKEKDRYLKILKLMKNIPKGKRTCRYTGVLAVYDPNTKKFWVYKNNLEGTIATKPKINEGFGYDPIFISTKFNKYYSSLLDSERDAISHRGLGIKKFLKKMKKISLIELTEKHIPLFYKWWNDKKLRELTSEVYTPMKDEKIDKTLLDHLKNKNGHDFIINANDKLIGHILIQKKLHKKYYEIYIAIGEKRFLGKGYGTEAVEKTTEWFFRKFPEENCIELEVNADNPRARRCYEKSGFKIIRIKHNKNQPDEFLMRKYRKPK